ncbi:hypothetical protein BsWGS_06744 [Bradybaena similaris]
MSNTCQAMTSSPLCAEEHTSQNDVTQPSPLDDISNTLPEKVSACSEGCSKQPQGQTSYVITDDNIRRDAADIMGICLEICVWIPACCFLLRN